MKPQLESGKRFAVLKSKIKKSGKSEESAKAITATIGRNKFGATKMAKMAAVGKKNKS